MKYKFTMWQPSIKFELLECLGEGGQGTVYKALRRDRRARLEQTVAVKILHSRTAVDIWRREFESLSRVRSTYCVRALSFERIGRRRALILEYIDGVSLARLGSSCLLDQVDIDEIAAQIETGLKELHGQGVFHGDLSPQNVMIDRDGGVRLLDFGFANCALDSPRLTPSFSAPERLAGHPVTAAADLYSLGKVVQFVGGCEASYSDYCADEPERRAFSGLAPELNRRVRLATKVRAFQQRTQSIVEAQTMTQNRAIESSSSIRSSLIALAASFLILATTGASHISPPIAFAVLRVRTGHWHALRLDGRYVGYSPLSIPIRADQEHLLEWNSARGHGSAKVQLKAHESRTLGDSDFSH